MKYTITYINVEPSDNGRFKLKLKKDIHTNRGFSINLLSGAYSTDKDEVIVFDNGSDLSDYIKILLASQVKDQITFTYDSIDQFKLIVLTYLKTAEELEKI